MDEAQSLEGCGPRWCGYGPCVRAAGRVLALLLLLLSATGAGALETGGAAWSRTDLKPVSQPAVLEHRIVLYTAGAGDLWATGLDARSGRTVWQSKASPSFIAPGVAPGLAIAAGLVVYLRPARGPDGAAEVAALEPQSGREIWHSEVGLFTSWPTVCSNSARSVCVSGSLVRQTQPGTLLRFDARTGKLLASVTVSSNPSAREIGDGLFDSGRRNPERLVATTGPRVTWDKPLRQIFTLQGATTDWGWNIDRIGGFGVFVGSVSAHIRPRPRTSVTIGCFAATDCRLCSR